MPLDLIDAIGSLHRVRLLYADGVERIFEPHTYGIDNDDREMISGWLVSGGPDEAYGWNVLYLDEAISFKVLADRFPGPRPGYRQGMSWMKRIYSQI